MNIFYLDEDIYTNASYHCDKHVVKMILEYAQLLSTAHHVLESPLADQLYKKTHVNHPSAVWTRASWANYDYVYSLFVACNYEYYTRYNKWHATYVKLGKLLENKPDRIHISYDLTPPPQCMPDEYKSDATFDGTIAAYRNYYRGEKRNFAKWKYTKEPYWWNES